MNKKGLAITFSTLIISLHSNILMAAENAETSFLPPYWPLAALILIIIVFRKQLNCVPTPDLTEKNTPKAPEKSETTAPEPIIPDVSDNIDLKDDSNQCQASTAKGTRCKRTSSLEDAKVTIADKTYLLTTCKQHNTKNLKPFSELLK